MTLPFYKFKNGEGIDLNIISKNKQNDIWIKVEKIIDEDSKFIGYVVNFNTKLSLKIYDENLDFEVFSHKINNLLTSITINLSLLQDYKDKDQMFQELLTESERSAFKISEILKDINTN